MNKLVKGSIAGAAGIALLLGGAGTLAVWNDSATLSNAGTITAGTLTITEGTGGWDQTLGLIVPGDTLVYTETLSLVATGDNLAFEVSNNIADLVSASTFSTANMVTTDVDVQLNGLTVAPDASGHYQAQAGTYTVVVQVTVDFPESTSDKIDQGAVLNLSSAAVTVTQIAPTP